MKYLCLVFTSGSRAETLFERDYGRYYQELRRCGFRSPADVIERVEPAATVRVRRGALTVTPGPATEAGEPLAGFLLIEARDLNEAIRRVANLPPARTGRIEVRAIAPDDVMLHPYRSA